MSLLPGIGPKYASRLASQGISDWLQLREDLRLLPLAARARIADEIDAAEEEIATLAFVALGKRIPRSEQWRLAAAFPDQTLFLDIETTGLSRYYHSLTMTGWSLGGLYKASIGKDHLGDAGDLRDDLLRASVLVTFNGSSFDVPFLKSVYPEIEFPHAHVDLRHAVRRVGLSGSQKRLEAELGIARARDVVVRSGAEAPGLWFKYQRGDAEALKDLVTYNHADVEGLRRILNIVVSRHVEGFVPEWRPATLAFGQGPGRTLLTPFVGQSGPRIRLRDLDNVDNLTVVGIDLSGGPRSISGWARVRGSDATTLPLRTDEEILSLTLGARPDLVSIDAPLSLPVGRTSVLDSDPARDEFGITREAERLLWKRGVNTYPSLIRSMQGLTARGILLASILRSRGIPVIESFPGAMQDILGMPRKGVSVEFLKQAVIEYGLQGDFVDRRVVHDEVDALSSAIVGQLFWANRYEALGNEAEDYLIIPSVSEPSADPEAVVGLSGRTGSGKSTVAGMLKDALDYLPLSYGSTVASISRQARGSSSRADLIEVGERVHLEYGQRWLGARLLDARGQASMVCVDGLRYPEDHAYLTERFGSRFLHIHLEVDDDTRAARLSSRPDIAGYAAGEGDSVIQLADQMSALSEIVIPNDGSLNDLRVAVLEVAPMPRRS